MTLGEPLSRAVEAMEARGIDPDSPEAQLFGRKLLSALTEARPLPRPLPAPSRHAHLLRAPQPVPHTSHTSRHIFVSGVRPHHPRGRLLPRGPAPGQHLRARRRPRRAHRLRPGQADRGARVDDAGQGDGCPRGARRGRRRGGGRGAARRDLAPKVMSRTCHGRVQDEAQLDEISRLALELGVRLRDGSPREGPVPPHCAYPSPTPTVPEPRLSTRGASGDGDLAL